MVNKIELFQKDAGLPTNKTKLASDADELIDLETKLAEILVPEEDRRNFTELYNLRRLSDLQELMPLVDWKRFFHAVAPFSTHNYLSSNPEILIVEIDFMRRITELLQSTDPRIITNYVLMRYSSSWSGEMGERYEDILQDFHRVMYGKQQKAPRWKDCTSQTMHRLQYATGAMYVRKAFDPASKNVTLEMIDDLQDVFHEILLNTDWMDEKTRATALDKAKQILPQIAYPDFILDDTKLDNHYSGLDVHDNEAYSDMLDKVGRWSIEYAFKRLTKPVDRTEFNFNAAVVNAYYSSTSNAIKFPAAILQAPFFHHTFPRSLNYGGIGAVIGHEITHGFDDQGRQFDGVGNLRDWWDEEVQKKFEDRTQCIIDQYAKIEVPGTGLKINGKLTQGENIADNGGIKQAYRAYKNYIRKHGEEKRVKGLEQYNNEQMFFLGYATVWCGHSTDDSMINLILTDPHSPQRYRVNQVLANQPEFAAAFKCEVGSPMNPTERCSVW
ncbi:peptidase family M13 [Oesophagostomum dentatum]|uniref:Peptidase family M13 n=1 Tax=Oesophagostomum dentatum TaxID=61180 RepID=A0A0B1TUL7_OESDE|nr:peptidase family M13 [Oesophagostomum dentatum]